MPIKLAVPNKGRLNERSLEMLKRAGLEIENGGDRLLFASVKNGNFSVLFLRAQDIVRFVQTGAVDAGITGWDLVLENGNGVELVREMGFGKCRLSVAVPESSGINSLEDIADGSRVATSFPNMTKQFFESIGKKVEIAVISGAAEVMPRMGVADFITDLVSSGSTLKSNNLRELAVISDSQAVLIASKNLHSEKMKELEELANALESVEIAEHKKYLMADVPVAVLDEVRTFLPGIDGPTVMNIAGRDDVVAIHVVIDKSQIYNTVNKLKKLGASGILIVPIDRMVP
ncbi:ATP phosphoribosyltransferase [Candidatus Methanomassiliicoccus intestinalis]|uniref:ATP phosphoribosyltransferase n=1 Tax=Methanomassiliicoccus intestinalis (strain Issoire-Mx1) TaxID=1295009 RepID=R9T7T4_METII|nr:ATP phosphoribosyltransferase [Candidatus Methanomassiliicoccus intestinalis]AGN26770.1 ATP phosphoribosyltransferase [Candidatus Methanomassiliicoccus intestinalis Issoire-Mx1]